MVEVCINQVGDKFKSRWGYEVNSPILNVSAQYGTRAYLLDGYFLLEERRGSTSSDRWVPFGIVKNDQIKEADLRMLARARDCAKKLLENLVPKLVENIDEQTRESERPADGKYNHLNDAEMRRKYEMPIAELDLSVRAANILDDAKINDVGQLVEKTERDLYLLRGLGRTTLREIKRKVTDIGLSLRVEN